MKGMIFNLFEKFVSENFGQEAYEDIQKNAKLITKEPFVGPGKYPDEDFMELVRVACEKFKINPFDAQKTLGEYCFPELVKLTPHLAGQYKNTRDFLIAVDRIIHVEVKKLYPDSELPEFDYENSQKDTLLIKYTSKKKLCFFMEGLIHGCAKYFSETVKTKQTACYHNGNDHCLMHVVFS